MTFGRLCLSGFFFGIVVEFPRPRSNCSPQRRCALPGLAHYLVKYGCVSSEFVRLFARDSRTAKELWHFRVNRTAWQRSV